MILESTVGFDKTSFSKYQGAGNDFVLIDLTMSSAPLDLPSFARYLCNRRLGIGADGLLLLLPSSLADYRMCIFNADGSEASMCGNGIRCLFDFIQKYKEGGSTLSIETLAGVLRCKRDGKKISVDLGPASIIHWPIEIFDAKVFVVDTGVPHAVLFVDKLDLIDLEKEGREIRLHPHFLPHGVNVNFVLIHPDGKLAIRTYERGVESETLACGTGAAAAAFVAMKHYHLASPIHVLTRKAFEGKKIEYSQHLHFCFPEVSPGLYSIEMIGGAQEVFTGEIESFLSPLHLNFESTINSIF